MSFKAFASDSQAAADYCLEHFPDTAAATVRLAEELCANTFTFREHWEMERTNIPVTFDGEIDWEHVPAGDPEWTYALNRHTCFPILAKAYLYTGEERYAKTFARIANSWLKNAVLCEKTKNGSWRSLEAGLRAENWLRAMAVFERAPCVSGELFERMEKSLRQHADYLLRTSGDFQILSNWGVLQDCGLFLLGLYFNEQDWCATAVHRLARNLEVQVLRDGSHWEQSPLYHCEVLHCFLCVIAAGRQNTYIFPDDFLSGARRMCHALAVWLKPNGHLPAQGDSDDLDARDIIAQGAYLFSDGVLKHYAAGRVYEENIWDFGVEFLEPYNELKSAAPEHSSAALADSGNFFMRHGQGENAVWLQFHCGPLGSGHGHADQLHISLAAFGQDILVDSGRYTYVNSPERRALKAAAAHNTTRVDGQEFSEQLDSWGYKTLAMPLKGEYSFGERADFVSGAHLGYLLRGVLTRRRVLFIKPDIFLVLDTFYAEGQHRYEQFFHFGEGESSPLPGGALFAVNGVTARVLCPGASSASLQRHPISREYNALCECDTLVAECERVGTHTMVSVISVAESGAPHTLHAEILPVRARRREEILPQSRAQGVRIEKNGKVITVLCCHEEIISEVELLETGGHFGYGKLLLFGEGMPETGLCMEW